MSITIDSIQYDNYIEQEPDIKKGKLYDRKMFYYIYPEDYNKLEKGTHISYTIGTDHYNTGTIIKYINPNTFILKDTRLLYIWHIKIGNNTNIFVKDTILFRKENIIKEILFEEYNNGNTL